MSTRSKLGRTRLFLAELEYSINNSLYAKHYGSTKLVMLSEMLAAETYDTKSAKEQASVFWLSIDDIVDSYEGPFSTEVKSNLTNPNCKI